VPSRQTIARRLRRGLSHLRPTAADPLPPTTWDHAWDTPTERRPTFPGLVSQACTRDQIDTDTYLRWNERLNSTRYWHRKQWEWHYILQAIEESGELRPDRRALGFGVGTEPITPYLAAQGVLVTATDLPPGSADVDHWSDSGQHAAQLDDMNADGICDPDTFRRNVTFRPVDMTKIPNDLSGFDITWSSCAFEHLGSLEAGMAFMTSQMRCVRPGGVAVHTTEFNVSSNIDTVSSGTNVAYRRRDIEELMRRLRADGHGVEATFFVGDHEMDRHIDVYPWTNTHLKSTMDRFVITSFGLIVRAAD
jgi:2-polyprenyl-3-methyl-5-hydroxy-6-metoxy-1,4-benzoquinol methylase